MAKKKAELNNQVPDWTAVLSKLEALDEKIVDLQVQLENVRGEKKQETIEKKIEEIKDEKKELVQEFTDDREKEPAAKEPGTSPRKRRGFWSPFFGHIE